MLPLPPHPPPPCPPPPHLFLSIVSTKHPIQAPVTPLKAGSSRPGTTTLPWETEKDVLLGRKGRREMGKEEWHSAAPVVYWNAHLVAMCDWSGGCSGANDGIPEASSIRPGLAGLPARATEEAMPVGARLCRRCAAAAFLSMWVNVANGHVPWNME